MRELKRSIARANMKKAGFTHINRKRGKTELNPKGQSFFAQHWREFVKPSKKLKKQLGLI